MLYTKENVKESTEISQVIMDSIFDFGNKNDQIKMHNVVASLFICASKIIVEAIDDPQERLDLFHAFSTTAEKMIKTKR